MPETAKVDEKTSAKREADEKKKLDERAKREEADAKAAEEQAKQNEADVETFLSAHRGEKHLRGVDGSLDLPAFVSAREAEKAKRDEDEQDEQKD